MLLSGNFSIVWVIILVSARCPASKPSSRMRIGKPSTQSIVTGVIGAECISWVPTNCFLNDNISVLSVTYHM